MNFLQGLISKEMFNLIHDQLASQVDDQIQITLRKVIKRTIDEILDDPEYREKLTEHFYVLIKDSIQIDLTKDTLFNSFEMPQSFNDIVDLQQNSVFVKYVNDVVKPVLTCSSTEFLIMLRTHFPEAQRWNDSTITSFHSKLKSSVFRKSKLKERMRHGGPFVKFFFNNVFHMHELIKVSHDHSRDS